MSTIPEASQKGFANASSYDTHRPSYPSSAVNSLLCNLHIDGLKGAKVIDLAAGTGKFTELLASREEGFEIIAVEPNDAMRGELERKKLRGVEVRKGEARDMQGVESQMADAVVVAQVSYVGVFVVDDGCVESTFRYLGSLVWNADEFSLVNCWKAFHWLVSTPFRHIPSQIDMFLGSPMKKHCKKSTESWCLAGRWV